MTKKLMKKYKLVAWLSVLGVIAIALFALAWARSAAHAAPATPNSVDMTSVTADEQGEAQGDLTYKCQPNSNAVSVVLFVEDHDTGLVGRGDKTPICDGKVHKTTIFIPGKNGQFYSLGNHVTAIAAVTDKTDTAVGNPGSAAFDKENVTL